MRHFIHIKLMIFSYNNSFFLRFPQSLKIKKQSIHMNANI